MEKKFHCIPEIARSIIIEQVNSDGDALPWKNKERYKELMMEQAVSSYQLLSANNEAITFFDRGIPDTLAYARLENLSITKEMNSYAHHYRYNPKVFILPPWPEIYTTDTERKQSWEEALQTDEILASTYTDCSYELIEIPAATPKQRADFAMNIVNLHYQD